VFQIATKRTKAESIETVERPFKRLQWYYRHQEKISRALRV
jgi:hypothetical protein